MIEKLETQEFDRVYSIMERSFPPEEYRPYEAQKALLDDPAYTVWCAREENEILGFAAVWQLEGWLFLEHLAVAPEHRSRGIGAQLLQFLGKGRCCLEAEPPETEMACRRIGFYERNGFSLNSYPYVQPSLGAGRRPVALQIMTSGSAVTPEEFQKLKALLYTRVYGQQAPMAKLYMLSSTADTINTAFILQSGSSVAVVDGGFPQEAEHLRRVLRELGGKVDAWFLTHAHDDHISALFTLLKQHPDIRVERVYYNFPSDEFLCRHLVQQRYFTTQDLLDTLRGTLKEYAVPTVTVQTGDRYDFDGFCVRVLRTPDEAITYNAVNNASCVFRVEFPKKSILFLGDLGVEGGHQLLETTPPELLRADFVQMAHHGQQGVSKEVYQAVQPRFCLWCAPTWLWDNMGPGGYNTGHYKTLEVRGWMDSIPSVEGHYRMIDGDQIIPISLL